MLKLENLTIKFNEPLFNNQSLYIKDNCVTLITGKSGCGKTTLLYKLGLIDFNKNDGNYYVDNVYINDLSNKQKTLIRRYDIGFVFQDYLLYNHFNVFENIEYYATISGKSLTKEEAQTYLNKVHLDIALDRMIYTLSSGQRQRLAIACSLVKEASILILDEPTSALDEDNTIEIFKILNELKNNKTIIITSHNTIAREYCDEIIQIEDGNINKIKSININKNNNKLVIKKGRLPFKTYINYIKKQYLYMKKAKIMIMSSNIIILLFCIIASSICNYYIEQSKSSISKNQSGWMYVSNLKDIKGINVDKYYPYYETHLTIYGSSYSVIPYYDENDITDKIWTEFDMTKEKGVYLSQTLFYEYRNGIVPTKYVTFQDSSTNKDLKFLYKGILLKGVKSEYIKSDKYLYMHYSLINNKLKPTKVKGYTLFFNSYDKYVKQKEILEDKGYKVTTYNEFEDIQSFIDKLNTIQNITITCIVIIGILILGYLYRTYIQQRSKEFALLKSMGLTNINISTLTFLETLIMNIVGTIIIMLIAILITDINILDLIILELIVLLFIYLLITIMIIRLKPIKVLRNE